MKKLYFGIIPLIILITGFSAEHAAPVIDGKAVLVQQTVAYKIGDTGPAGGIIFYVKGNANDGWRCLEAAPANTDEEPELFMANSAFGDIKNRALGVGKENTRLLMEIFNKGDGGIDTAPWICDQLEVNGFNDWYQPSIDELIMLYKNTHGKDGSGRFRAAKYWSSTYTSDGAVLTVDFSNGAESLSYPGDRICVRAIRQF
ncbi:MAG: DUF1566 domain-containing protein [Treponema sp.]|jgi:hypothetical protein|nr:DUF1566 domain-containing protein [Treponema sp.]